MKETDWKLERLFRAVALFDQVPVLEEAIFRFRQHDWTVYEFDCQELSSSEELLNAILHHTGLMSPDFVYKNIQMIQFWDLFRLTPVPDSGCVLAFRNLEVLPLEYPEFFQELLQVTAQEHYRQLRHGARFMACVHWRDRSIRFEPLYSLKASWNEQTSFSAEADEKAERFRALFTKHSAAMEEANDWLNQHGHPQLRRHTLRLALAQVTGATSFDELLSLDLNASEILRRVGDFDFESLGLEKRKRT